MLTKKKSKEILRHELKWYGLQGEHHDGFFEAATDVIEEREDCYSKSEEWISKNYPSLSAVGEKI